MSECKLYTTKHYWDKSRNIYNIKYIPDNELKYKAFEIGTYYSTRPTYYKTIGDMTTLYFEDGHNEFARMETKYLNKLKKFYRIRLKETLLEVPDTKDITTVSDILADIGIKGFSIGYNQTRTIKRAMFREAIAYAKSYCGCLIFFRKRGGLLCYHISKVIHDCRYQENKGHNIKLKSGLELLRDIKQSGLGEVYLPPLVEEEIINQMILDEL